MKPKVIAALALAFNRAFAIPADRHAVALTVLWLGGRMVVGGVITLGEFVAFGVYLAMALVGKPGKTTVAPTASAPAEAGGGH